jgi:thiamine kinase-like enzyme
MEPAVDQLTLDERLDAVPELRGARTVQELAGGLTNVNLKVTVGDEIYVVRLFRGDASLLGIDRDAEHHNTRAAAEAGVAAAVVAYRPELAMLVIRFIDGVTYDNASFGQPGVVARVGAACRRLHDGPRFVNDFDMFARQPTYLRTVRENGFAFFPGYEDHLDRFDHVRRALSVRDEGTVPCNNDLLAGNFVDDGQKLWLIDYEYSGNNDACFELGNISTECDLDLDQLEELVTAYYGRTLRNKVARARLQAVVSEYGWSLWGAIQAAVSAIDFDFTSWGRERYDKAVAAFTGDDFERLLDEVQRDD